MNIEHRTSNIERRMEKNEETDIINNLNKIDERSDIIIRCFRLGRIGRWMLDLHSVLCWTFTFLTNPL